MAVDLYRLAGTFPREEIYRLTAQITRAAASVPANIAEGAARASTKEYRHFLSIARGSVVEVETFLLLAVRLDYLAEEEAVEKVDLLTQIGKMLTSLRRSLS